jgi:arylsulfatase A-like enzyme
MMEVYAGALSHADYQIGRLIDAIADSGQLDNTMIIFIMGDNGASAEGSLQGRKSAPRQIRTTSNGELYHIHEDYSQANNLADKNPDKLKELQAAFDTEAKKNTTSILSTPALPQGSICPFVLASPGEERISPTIPA